MSDFPLVLIVGLDLELAAAIQLRLNLAGFRVLVEFNPSVGFEACQSPPALVILPINAAVSTELVLHATVTRPCRSQGIPMVAYSFHARDLRHADALGLAGYVDLTRNMEELVRVVRNAIPVERPPSCFPVARRDRPHLGTWTTNQRSNTCFQKHLAGRASI